MNPDTAAAERQDPRSARAKALISYVEGSADPTFATVLGVSVLEAADLVDILVEPQLPQDRAVPILDREPIRLIIPHDDERAPGVLSLREDFPLDLVHTVLERTEHGRILCLWEESWVDLRRSLTSQDLIERVRSWFSRTAAGELHQEGQALEPLLEAVADTVILPAGPPADDTLHIHNVRQRGGRYTLVLGSEPLAGEAANEVQRFALFHRALPTQVHGAVQHRPRNLDELCGLFDTFNLDYRGLLGSWLADEGQTRSNDRPALLLVTMPKAREARAKPEAWEVWAFLPDRKLGPLGALLGTTFDEGRGTSVRRIPPVPPEDLSDVELMGWRVVRRLGRADARRYAATPGGSDRALVGIGAGAIGSNVIANTIRAGVGTWTVIDDDVLLPHNTVRQAQTDHMVGWPKAPTAAALGNAILAERSCTCIEADLLRPGDAEGQLVEALRAADLVVDFSASPAVLGRLSETSEIRRAASMFFSPDGQDLVVLLEPADRSLRLDELEAQYFASAAIHPEMEGHLAGARTDMLRYANACQDLTRPLPPWMVQTLCGIAAGRLIAFSDETGPEASAWRLDPRSGAVRPVTMPVSGVGRIASPDFVATVAESTLDQMREWRGEAGREETGGVLLGTFDLQRRRAHVVAALPAPADSQQSPTHFVRGARHLRPAVERISASSAGMLGYLGEWHSHPDGVAARPSADDEGVYAYLRCNVGPTGRPYLMCICGRDETWLRAGWDAGQVAEGSLPHAP